MSTKSQRACVSGSITASYVDVWGHWIAFALFVALGVHILYEGLNPSREQIEKPSSHSFLKITLTAFGTSIDAMAVGISLAFVEMSIFLAAGLIGLATTVMVTLGVMLGRVVGSLFGQKAEIIGGLTLIAVGAWILSGNL
ncbi:manganese efflux pump MntP family protein [Marinobacter sp. LV10MA510-1]|uniref:manganese efflux pump MntP n=1 Tax=Marinobacter sp. LV10MA510-1 TaxID=1415567 RepID=UPI001E3DE4F6|nr:manganese efflux pump MntP family protein [Marinobacter sp. LV10MA510-1]